MASATELVIAFVMASAGSLKYALHGMVDIRLAMIILAGSLFGIQLGAIGTTYVKPFMIKVVMGVIMGDRALQPRADGPRLSVPARAHRDAR